MVNGVFTIPLRGPMRGGSADLPASAERQSLGWEFVAGPENRLASAAVGALLTEAAQRFNPLVLYGPAACGKSHLARGLTDWWRQHDSAAEVLLLTASEFARQYASAIEENRLGRWRAGRRAALMVVEDLGQLAGKRGAQQELCNWLDAIWRRDGMVVVTARTLPHQSPALLAPLRSRLAAGLAVPLAPAGPAARRVILERAAAARGLALPKRVVQMMADGWDQNVPSLLGALMELEMTARLEDGSFDAQRIRDYVAGRAGGQRLTLRAIALLTAKYFGLRLSELKSPVRRQSIVAARGVAIYLSRQLTDKSLDEIGKYFGGRDHTTVLHAFRRTERLARRDPSARHAISELKRTLSPS